MARLSRASRRPRLSLAVQYATEGDDLPARPLLRHWLAAAIERDAAVTLRFVGAAEAKDALRASGLKSVSNVSEKGGPAVAVAAFSALLQNALGLAGSQAGWGPGAPATAAMADDDTGW